MVRSVTGRLAIPWLAGVSGGLLDNFFISNPFDVGRRLLRTLTADLHL